MEAINAEARTSGNDAIRDALILRLCTDTACRRGGNLAARAYVGHPGGGSASSSTATYARASLHEVAVALAGLTGEEHPLAQET